MVVVKEWQKTTRVDDGAEERGGQCKAKEAENKRTNVLKKGDGPDDRGGEQQRR
jgi:hypothetical protein